MVLQARRGGWGLLEILTLFCWLQSFGFIMIGGTLFGKIWIIILVRYICQVIKRCVPGEYYISLKFCVLLITFSAFVLLVWLTLPMSSTPWWHYWKSKQNASGCVRKFCCMFFFKFLHTETNLLNENSLADKQKTIVNHSCYQGVYSLVFCTNRGCNSKIY